MALAGLVAVLAIPILVIDSSSTAEGVVESAALEKVTPEPFEPAEVDEAGAAEAVETEPVRTVSTVYVRPDVTRLAAAARSWGHVREDAIEAGLVVAQVVDAPSDTRLELLPVVPDALPPEPDPEPEASAPTTTIPVDNGGDGGETPETPVDPTEETPDPTDPEPTDPDDPGTEPTDPEPDPDPEVDTGVPAPPAQLNGRVPPPAGGPTAAQWDRLRRCESTHNYGAVSPTGLYRGAYQFSQQTWDWVAGIHYPYLVGIDPAAAAPGWQDVMAYTLYAMRGWDQWPVCGKHLLG